MLCDGVEEAKRLAFMGPERHKVVALDGTLLSKSGFMTGGLTGSEADRAQRFDEHRTTALKQACATADFSVFWPARHMALRYSERTHHVRGEVAEEHALRRVPTLHVQKRAQYEKELGDLPAERAAGQDEQRLSAQIAGLGKQLEYKAVDLKATEEKLAKTTAELQTLAQVLFDMHHLLFMAGQRRDRHFL